jgi:hypothetical protein
MPQMSQNTVFVVGAGASKEAHLPIGDDLKSKISTLLDICYDTMGYTLERGDYTLVKALKLHVKLSGDRKGDFNLFFQAAGHISDALPLAISIDNFIDQHRNNKHIELCGKLAIVRSILDAEKESLLHFEMERVDSNINFNALEKTWYISFFKLLTEDCAKDELKERFESITLIIFNYDRCIEHFLYYALQIYYKLPGPEAAGLVKNINIYHPYGSIGTLPWINQNGAVAFGSKQNPEQILNITEQIKTFTEGIDPELSKIGEIRKHMKEAKRLVFLGFAFHKLNMRLLSTVLDRETKFNGIRCFATTFDISESDKEIIKEQVVALYANYEQRLGDIEVNLENLECGQFFKEFWRSLAF